MSAYSKAIGAVIGNIIGMLAVWLASVSPLASCTGEGDLQVCTVLGLGTAQLTAAVMMIVTTFAVYKAPPNG